MNRLSLEVLRAVQPEIFDDEAIVWMQLLEVLGRCVGSGQLALEVAAQIAPGRGEWEVGPKVGGAHEPRCGRVGIGELQRPS